MTGIDWAALMQVGLHGLGMQPDAFWRLTPVELRIKLGAQVCRRPIDPHAPGRFGACLSRCKKGAETWLIYQV